MVKKRGEKEEEIKSVSEVTLRTKEIARSNTKLLLFGGKGGVGKSTNATATALHLSNQGKKVLVVSSDPAPSLSVIFDKEIGGKLTEIKENLYAMEIDAAQAVESFKAKYGGIVLDAISTIVPIEKEALDDIPNEVAPGLDELFALERVLNFMTEGYDYDVIVWDTAPTGHTLRLLFLPTSIDSYATGGIKLHSRFAGVLNTIKMWFGRDTSKDAFLDALVELKETAESIKNILSNAGRTEFVPVVIPEALALYQTERLKAFLDEQSISIKRMIINGVVPESDCRFCVSRRKMQQRYIDELHKRYDGNVKIIEMPLFPEEVKGLEAISRYANVLYGGEWNG
ncbi:MAG: TRC40/GET3/ArsA family transport-energizing ATPase [archaeon]|nr:TRC40/GET3/ArsA family transport-energizing ATPase [archaeon]